MLTIMVKAIRKIKHKLQYFRPQKKISFDIDGDGKYMELGSIFNEKFTFSYYKTNIILRSKTNPDIFL